MAFTQNPFTPTPGAPAPAGGQQAQAQAPLGQALEGQLPENIGVPSDDPAEIETRKSGWKEFIDHITTDPQAQASTLQFALQLMQPVQPGQTGLGHAASALQTSLGTYGRTKLGAEDRALKKAETERKAGLEERKVGVSERGLEAETARAETTADLKKRELDIKEKHNAALGAYYKALGVAKGGTVMKDKDVKNLAFKLVKAQFENDQLFMETDAFDVKYPNGIAGALPQVEAMLRQQMIPGTTPGAAPAAVPGVAPAAAPGVAVGAGTAAALETVTPRQWNNIKRNPRALQLAKERWGEEAVEEKLKLIFEGTTPDIEGLIEGATGGELIE